MLAVWKKLRKDMGLVRPRRVEDGDGRRDATGSSDSEERTTVGRNNDRPVLAPGSPGRQIGVADRLRRTTARGNALDLPVGEEADVAAVRRPERLSGTFGPRQWRRCQRIQRLNPEHLLGPARARGKGNPAAIGRHRDVVTAGR